MPQTLITDNRLAELFKGLSSHYNEYKTNHPSASIEELHQELYDGMFYYLRELCKLKQINIEELSEADINEAYDIVTIFLSAQPLLKSKPHKFHRPIHVNINVEVHSHYQSSYGVHDFFWDWWFISSFDSNGNAGAEFLILLGCIALVVAAFYATYYVALELHNAIERFEYNEGWMRATLAIANFLISEVVSATLSALLLEAPLTEFFYAAGITSSLPMLIGVLCVTMIGTMIGYYLLDKVVQYVTSDSTALYQDEPERFGLTKADEEKLLNMGYDTTQIKCAIVALREEMGDEAASVGVIHRSEKAQKQLDVIRQLRRGELDCLQVGDMKFDFSPEKPSRLYQNAGVHTFYGVSRAGSNATHIPDYEYDADDESTGLRYHAKFA